MLKRFARLASIVVLSTGVVYAEEKPKTSTPPQKEPAQKSTAVAPAKTEVKPITVRVEVKATTQPAKVEVKNVSAAPAKTDAKPTVANFVPRELHGAPVAKRLTEIQTELEAIYAARGPARAEADKARQAADQATRKADDLNHKMKWLEEEKNRLLTNALEQNRESAQQRADQDAVQKLNRLEAQVRDLTARLEAVSKQKSATAPTACQSCKDKDKKPAASAKTEPAKK